METNIKEQIDNILSKYGGEGDDYPLILTTGRSLYHFHTGTLTRKVKGLNILRREGLVEINPDDASALGITDGEIVKVVSRRGGGSG